MNPNSLYYSKSDRDSTETSSLPAKYFMSGNDAHFKHNEILCNSTTTEMKRSSSQTEFLNRYNESLTLLIKEQDIRLKEQDSRLKENALTIENLEINVNTLLQENSARYSMIIQLEDEVRKCRELVSKKDSINNDLNAELAKSREELKSEIKNLKKNHKAVVSAHEEKTHQLREENEELKNDVSCMESEIKRLKNKLDEDQRLFEYKLQQNQIEYESIDNQKNIHIEGLNNKIDSLENESKMNKMLMDDMHLEAEKNASVITCMQAEVNTLAQIISKISERNTECSHLEPYEAFEAEIQNDKSGFGFYSILKKLKKNKKKTDLKKHRISGNFMAKAL